MPELRPFAKLKEMRALVLVKIHDCIKDVRISIRVSNTIKQMTAPHHSQTLGRLGLMKETTREVSEGESANSEGMDLPFIKGNCRILPQLLKKTKARVSCVERQKAVPRMG